VTAVGVQGLLGSPSGIEHNCPLRAAWDARRKRSDALRLSNAFVVAEKNVRFFMIGPPSVPPNWLR